jgi:hypothetical protein
LGAYYEVMAHFPLKVGGNCVFDIPSVRIVIVIYSFTKLFKILRICRGGNDKNALEVATATYKEVALVGLVKSEGNE